MARKSRKHIAEPIFTSVSPFINTALYIRLSVEDNKKRGNSIETQKMVLKDYLSNKPEFRIYDTYIDNGTTGTNFNREGFQRMLSDIEAGKIDCVIVKDLSRLGRNSIDSGYYIEQYFPSHNVRFIAVTDQFDSENPDNLHGGIILPLKNMINEAYSLDIGRKIKVQARQDMKEGKFVGARAPFGYKKDPDDCHKLIVDPVAAPVVQQIFQWAYEKVGLNRIVLMLNEGGYPAPSNYKYSTGEITHENLIGEGFWQTRTVMKILKEEKYTGDMVQGHTKTVAHKQRPAGKENLISVAATHEAIVSREVFDEVQKYRIEVAEKYKQQEKIPYSPNIFKGLIFCSHCGRSLHRQRARRKKGDVYRFQCLTPSRVHKEKCVGVSIKENELIDTVIDILKKELSAALGDYALLVEDGTQWRKREKELQDRRNTASRMIQQNQDRIQVLYEDMVSGLVDKDDFFLWKKNYEDKMSSAKAELAECEKVAIEIKKQFEQYKTLEKDEKELKAGCTLTAELVSRLIERIEVDHDKHVSIRFRFRTEFQEYSKAVAQ